MQRLWELPLKNDNFRLKNSLAFLLRFQVALRTAGKIKEVSLGMNSVGFNEVGEDRAANVLRLIRGTFLHSKVISCLKLTTLC